MAINIDAGTTPLFLSCPAWKRWETATTVKPGTIILHSRADEAVPFSDSEELVTNSDAQHFLDERFKLVYQEGMTRKRLGLAIIVNSQAILETIESLP